MFTSISNKKNNSGKDFLQKELEFYTNLLAQHEKRKEKDFNLPCTSSSTVFKQRSYSTRSKSSPKLNEIFAFNKMSKPGFKIVKEDPYLRNDYINPKAPSLQTSKTTKLIPIHKPLASTKIFSNHNVKDSSKAINGSKLVKNNYCKHNSSVMYDSKMLAVSNAGVSSKLLRNQEASKKSDSRALMGEIAAVTEQLKMKSRNNGSSKELLTSQTMFKKINSSVKVGGGKYFHMQNLKQSSNKNNSYTSLNKVNAQAVVTTMGKVTNPKLLYTENSTHCQKGTLKTHKILLEKLNTVEKFLNASTKNSAKVLNKADKNLPKSNVKLVNNFSQRIVNLNSSNVSASLHKPQYEASVNLGHEKPVENNKFLRKQDFKLNKFVSTNNSSIQKSLRFVRFNQMSKHKFLSTPKERKHLPMVPNPIKTQYKVVNKGHQLKRLSTSSISGNVSLEKRNIAVVQKNSYRLVNDHKADFKVSKVPRSCSKRIFIKSVHLSPLAQNTFSPLKKTPNKVCKKYSPFSYRSVMKHRQNPTLNKSYKLSKSLLENVKKSPDSSGVDVDLLLELAAENKKKLTKSVCRKRLYKSKNRLINSYSVQARTAKMIKTKYFNPYKKSADTKNLLYLNKSFKGYRSNYESNISKSSKSFPHKLKSRKCHQKKIVYLGGEKFIIGSTGRTLKKLHNQSIKSAKIFSHKKYFKGKPVMKTPSPVSKMIANRALNRSINQALSASTRKKMQKINTYCKFYNRFGRCNKGIKCAFVHDPSKIAVCTRFLRGTCKSEKCLFSHEISPGKMAICSFFLQDACTKEDCPYLHEKLSSDAELCKAFVQGYCPNGKDCKKAHILICSKFLRGQCDKGKDCIFPHPMKNEKLINPKSTIEDNQQKDEFQLETVLRYFESNPQESLSKGLVVPSRVKSLPEEQDFISLIMDKTS